MTPASAVAADGCERPPSALDDHVDGVRAVRKVSLG